MPIPASSVAPTLDELKAHLNITSATHDDELLSILDAAVEVVEGYVGPLDGQTVTERYYNRNPALPLLLRQYPVQAVTSISDVDGNVFEADSYTVDLDTGRVWLARWGGGLRSWSFWGPGVGLDVTVTYTTGRTSLPASIRLAILIVAARLWETQRGNAPSALPVSDDPSGLDPGGLPLLPPRAQELLRQYLRGPVVA